MTNAQIELRLKKGSIVRGLYKITDVKIIDGEKTAFCEDGQVFTAQQIATYGYTIFDKHDLSQLSVDNEYYLNAPTKYVLKYKGKKFSFGEEIVECKSRVDAYNQYKKLIKDNIFLGYEILK